MNKLLTLAPLGLAGVVASVVVATQSPFALARDGGGSRGEDAPAVVRIDDHGRDHAEDGPHHARHRVQDDHGRDDRGFEDRGFDDRGRHHGREHAEDGRHHARHDGDDDAWDDHGRHGGRDDGRHHERHSGHGDDHGGHGGHGGEDHGGRGGDD